MKSIFTKSNTITNSLSKGLLLSLILLIYSVITDAQFTQQGSKLVGSGGIVPSNQGTSVSISSDGNTAIVGGYNDNNYVGAAWIYIRTGGVWSQQGSKLVGTGSVGTSYQGRAVAISSDGNTAIVGGFPDNNAVGAVWIFVRTGGVWSQQGSKLVGTGAVGPAAQGRSVSLSSDGNTAIVGGFGDNSNAGAVWVFTRKDGVWSQQGSKLVGTGAIGPASQGISVSISSDGNTFVVGGYHDNSNVGTAWVFTRSGDVWSQQGSKLVGTVVLGTAYQGISVFISSDGNTAIVGGYFDNNTTGAAWVYTRVGGVWSQQGNKLVGTNAVDPAYQGVSVSISSDGNKAIVGGYFDNSGVGATWVYTRTDGIWSQQGSKLVGTGAVGAANQGVSVSISSDGSTAIVGGYFDNSNAGAAWVFVDASVVAVDFISINAKAVNGNDVLINWEVAAENDVERYEIERSSDGLSFIKIGVTDANGGKFYNWLDKSPLAGNSYYRVKSIDKTEQIKYTVIVKVTVGNEHSAYNIVPNPATGNQLKVQFSNQPKGLYEMQLIDGLGRVILNTSLQHSGGSSIQIIPLRLGINSGIYQLKIISSDKIVSTQKVLVKRGN